MCFYGCDGDGCFSGCDSDGCVFMGVIVTCFYGCDSDGCFYGCDSDGCVSLSAIVTLLQCRPVDDCLPDSSCNDFPRTCLGLCKSVSPAAHLPRAPVVPRR